MFLVLVKYIRPLEIIDSLLDDHIAFLDAWYAKGVFLLSGRRVPRIGGVILARCPGRPELDAILAQDPFAVHGAAEYEVLEFSPTKAGQGLEGLLGQG